MCAFRSSGLLLHILYAHTHIGYINMHTPLLYSSQYEDLSAAVRHSALFFAFRFTSRQLRHTASGLCVCVCHRTLHFSLPTVASIVVLNKLSWFQYMTNEFYSSFFHKLKVFHKLFFSFISFLICKLVFLTWFYLFLVHQSSKQI